MRKTDISLLERKLQERGFSNLDNPLYDLSDEKVRVAYQKLQTDTKAEAISRDTTSWGEIKECVEDHVSRYGDGTIVIISGAAPHIFGAIPYLKQRIGARYVSTSSHKLSVDLIMSKSVRLELDKGTDEEKATKALNSIKVQMKRGLGVVKKLGYDTIEAYIADMSNVQNPRNLIFSAEETGLHEIYLGERNEQLHKILLDFIKRTKPTSILYIREDLNVEGIRNDFENGKPSFKRKLPRDEIFDYAKSQGIPVEFGAFGHRDSQSFGDFSLDRMAGLRMRVLYKF